MEELPREQIALPLGIKGVRVIAVERAEGSLTMRVQRESPFGVCPRCGVLSQKVNDRRVHLVKDRPIFGSSVRLEVVKRRFKCINDLCCAATFTEEIEGLPRGHSHTELFLRHLYELSKEMTYSGVSRHLMKTYGCRVSIATVYRWAHSHQRQGVDPPGEGSVEAEFVGLDEFSKGRGHDYSVVLVDLVKRKIIDMADGGKTKKAAKEVLSKVNPKKVKACAIDMWEPFHRACLEAIAGAEVVIDRFHVVKKVNGALDNVRKRVRGYFSSKIKRKALFKYRGLLLRGMEELSKKQQARLWELLSWNRELTLAYELKEVLRSIYAAQDPHMAKQEMDRWIAEAIGSGIREMADAGQIVAHWKKEVLNFFNHGITNAVTEGKINKIKTLRRKAYNYNSFQNLRMKILEQEGQTISHLQRKKHR